MTSEYPQLVDLIQQEYTSTTQNYPWILTFSGGKDSTLVAQLAFEAISKLDVSQRNRHVYLLSNDTLVESPEVIRHLKHVQTQIQDYLTQTPDMPITIDTTMPDVKETFWVCLIGKGYPTPNQKLRWCTDRLKIDPTSSYILKHVSDNGHAIVLTGVRSAESQQRAKTIAKYQNIEGTNLTPHTTLQGAFVFRPIMHLTTDDVWEMLSEFKPAWANDNVELIQLYRDAEGGECPIVLSKEEAPGCGTNSSRFGCWTCTVVKKDKSLIGFVETQKKEYRKYKLLIAFRNWLIKIRDNPEYRQVRRRNGKIQFTSNGKHIKGPFTVKTRMRILERLLKMQKFYGEELISQAEINEMQIWWTMDLLNEI